MFLYTRPENARGTVPQFDNEDMPDAQYKDLWVKYTSPTGGGSPIGLLLALTYAGSGTTKYELSYKTKEGPIVRVEMT